MDEYINDLHFTYDSAGPATVIFNNNTYFYLRNAQGDIYGLTDKNGNWIIGYSYDAWGNLLSQSTADPTWDTLANLNPLLYRGYVYDTETGLYYLSCRYYDPEICRFISADTFASTGQGLLGSNMFAYCLNNPVNMIDKTGHDAGSIAAGWGTSMWWLTLIDGPLPIGDILYFGVLLVLGGIALDCVASNPPIVFSSEAPEPPNIEYPGDDPTESPGDDYEWRGPDPQGGKRGGYANTKGKDSFHPDLNHPGDVDPHWDYNDGNGHKWRIFKGRVEQVK